MHYYPKDDGVKMYSWRNMYLIISLLKGWEPYIQICRRENFVPSHVPNRRLLMYQIVAFSFTRSSPSHLLVEVASTWDGSETSHRRTNSNRLPLDGVG